MHASMHYEIKVGHNRKKLLEATELCTLSSR